ncbi:SNF2-related protein [Aeromicrobium sp. UC242_57]|uniref:SNF2-related protein n=1 Tax=Aeromicrobium sp. UC242_57 TaxID=3374624 RepID=UPI0037913642
MGLGKTVMLIALHLQRAVTTNAPTLVICPASVLGNWEREISDSRPASTSTATTVPAAGSTTSRTASWSRRTPRCAPTP